VEEEGLWPGLGAAGDGVDYHLHEQKYVVMARRKGEEQN
jgi:hypothetical protein